MRGVVAVHRDRTRSGAAADHELVLALQARGLEIVGEYANAVSAHLGDGAVAVAVVHEPVFGSDAVGQRTEHARVRKCACPGDTKDAVGAEAKIGRAQSELQSLMRISYAV